MGALRNLLSLLTLPFSLSKVIFRLDKRLLRRYLSSLDPRLIMSLIKLLEKLGPDLTAKFINNFLLFAASFQEKMSQFLKPETIEGIELSEDFKRSLEGFTVVHPEILQSVGSFLGLIAGRTLQRMLESQELRRELGKLIKNLGLFLEETYRVPR